MGLIKTRNEKQKYLSSYKPEKERERERNRKRKKLWEKDSQERMETHHITNQEKKVEERRDKETEKREREKEQQ